MSVTILRPIDLPDPIVVRHSRVALAGIVLTTVSFYALHHLIRGVFFGGAVVNSPDLGAAALALLGLAGLLITWQYSYELRCSGDRIEVRHLRGLRSRVHMLGDLREWQLRGDLSTVGRVLSSRAPQLRLIWNDGKTTIVDGNAGNFGLLVLLLTAAANEKTRVLPQPG